MRCEQMAEHLTDLMEGNLAEEEEAAALEHLASCPACETVLAETRDVIELVGDHGRVPLSDEDKARMFGAISDAMEPGSESP